MSKFSLGLIGDTPEPKYGSETAAAFDITAQNIKMIIGATGFVHKDDDLYLNRLQKTFDEQGILYIQPGEIYLIGTGIKVNDMDKDMCLKLLMRSSSSLKKGLCALNAPGLIDSDYRGEIGIILSTSLGFNVTINKGERIAQILPEKVDRIPFTITDVSTETKRGEGGFGSTGK